jgi:cell wall-associated NlpC family hydrolase
VGLPWLDLGRDKWTGVDCLGLARTVLIEQKRIEIPLMTEDYLSTREKEECANVFRHYGTDIWRPISTGAEQPFDVVVFRRAGLPAHMGVVVKPGWMLHIEEGRESCIEQYRSRKWEPRLIGFCRHVRLINGDGT